MRHAQTRWNQERRIQGQQDTPLTDTGRRQALGWAKMLQIIRWDRILTSDLGRSVETADLLNRSLGLPVNSDSRLREQHWGNWTGKRQEEIRSEAEKMVRLLGESSWHFRPPGGEDRITVLRRSRTALLSAARRWPGQNVLVVVHAGVVAALLQHLSGRQWTASEPRLFRASHLHYLAASGADLRIEKIDAMDLR
jgi:probable phosphoglycerate mutase